eukprot:COSAG06_NODE_30831_length_532_cov_2.085648_1_plen_58_part_01
MAWPDQLHGLSAAKQRVSQAAGRRSFASAAGTCQKDLLLQRVHVQPQYQRASAHGTRH